MGGSRESVQDDQQKTSVGVSSSMSPTSSFAGGAVKDYEELSPIFIQFLDLVHNIVAQFPTAFEFTESLLAFVAEHTYRCGDLQFDVPSNETNVRCLGRLGHCNPSSNHL